MKVSFENMVWIPGGAFTMGSDHHYPEEAPAHKWRWTASGSTGIASPTRSSRASSPTPAM